MEDRINILQTLTIEDVKKNRDFNKRFPTCMDYLVKMPQHVDYLLATLAASEEKCRELESELPPINKRLLQDLMMCIAHCDEEPGKDGLCDCAWQIGTTLRKLEKKNKKQEAQLATLRDENERLRGLEKHLKEEERRNVVMRSALVRISTSCDIFKATKIAHDLIKDENGCELPEFKSD